MDDDPFFEPDPRLIINQLGRKHRYLSPASVQAAIVRGIEGQIRTPECLRSLRRGDAAAGST